MAMTLHKYTASIRQALMKALCIQSFPSQTVERHNAPEVRCLKQAWKPSLKAEEKQN